MIGRTLRAVVRNGRFEIEESAKDYPEGTRLSLIVESDMSDEERQELDTLLAERAQKADEGKLTSQEELYEKLGWK